MPPRRRRRPAGGRGEARAFVHEHHLTASRSGERIDPVAAAAECAECHLGIAGADDLSTLHVDLEACSRCHGEACRPLRTTAPEARGRPGRDLPIGRTPSMATGPGCERGNFSPEAAMTATRTEVEGFRHASPGHAAGDRVACHGRTACASRLREVEWPTVDGAACVACHLGGRFPR